MESNMIIHMNLQNKWATPPIRTLNRWDNKGAHTRHFRAVLIYLQWFCCRMKLFLLPRVAPIGSSLCKKCCCDTKTRDQLCAYVLRCIQENRGKLHLELKSTLYVCDRLFNSNCKHFANHLPTRRGKVKFSCWINILYVIKYTCGLLHYGMSLKKKHSRALTVAQLKHWMTGVRDVMAPQQSDSDQSMKSVSLRRVTH